MITANIFGALGIACTILIYQQKTRKGLILSKLLSDVLWFLHYFFLAAYSGAAIAVIGMVRELIFVNREKKWAKHPFWLVFFIGVSLGCAYFTWKGIFSIFPCIASAVSVISFWIGNPKLSRFLSYPISACMLTYDIASGSVMGIINELFAVISSIVGFSATTERRMLKMTKPVFKNKAKGPLQIVHDFRFTALNVKDDYSFLDTTSHEEKLSYMKQRVKRLYDNGYGGIVLNVDHINYLESGESFLRVKEVAEYAKSLGLNVWLYDEQYYPSGSAGGLTLLGRPELEASALSCVTVTAVRSKGEGAIRVPSPLGHSELRFATAVPIMNGKEDFESRIDVSSFRDISGGLCFDAPVGEWRVYCFFERVLYEATKLCEGTRASRRYINVRSKQAVERFYNVTFENGYNKYFDRLGDVVDAVFTDEPNTPLYISWKNRESRTAFESFSKYDYSNNDIPVYPFIPWHKDVPHLFKERYGYEISSVLPDIYTQTQNTKKARCDFYQLLSDMALEAFPKQMQEKLSGIGINLSGHYYGEEAFDVHPFYFGDILEHLSSMGIPGCDNLKSEPDALRYCVACKFASSAAHIAGKERVMIEASNMTDKNQNITLDVAKAAISMMFVHGVNLITSYYGERMLCDEEMRVFTNHISNLTTLFEKGRYEVDTFLYYPFEELCATLTPEGIVEIGDGFHDRFGIMETSKKLMQNRVTFDFINSKRLLSCEIRDGFILSTNGNRIYNIVLPKTGFIQNPELAEYLEKAKQKGVNVIIDGENTSLDGISRDLTLDDENPYLTFMHKSFEEYDLYMLMNTKDEPFGTNVNIPCNDGDSFCFVNAENLETIDVTAKASGNNAKISVEFDALSPVIICKFQAKKRTVF